MLPGTCRAPFCPETFFLPPPSPHCGLRVHPRDRPPTPCARRFSPPAPRPVAARSGRRAGGWFSPLHAAPSARPGVQQVLNQSRQKDATRQSRNVNCQSEAERRVRRRWARAASALQPGADRGPSRQARPPGGGFPPPQVEGDAWLRRAGGPGTKVTARVHAVQRGPPALCPAPDYYFALTNVTPKQAPMDYISPFVSAQGQPSLPGVPGSSLPLSCSSHRLEALGRRSQTEVLFLSSGYEAALG